MSRRVFTDAQGEPTQLGWTLYRLFRQHPLHLLPKRVVYRWTSRRARRRRRRRWARPGLLDPRSMPDGFSLDEARALWPGAHGCPAMAELAERRPELHRAVAARAEAAAEGWFDLLGSGRACIVDDRGHPRWHDDFKSGSGFPADRLYLDLLPRMVVQPERDIKVPWELSRFQHVFGYIWASPDRYGPAFLRQWRDWMRANPVGRGPNWVCAMEVALRAVSWTAAMACWWDEWDDQTRRAFWAALADHGHFIRDNLEYPPVARHNHYYSDIVGLAVLGAVLSGYPPAERWADFAAAELRKETLQQFARDGFDKECSTTYHRLMLELAVVGERACRVSGRTLGSDVLARLEAAFLALGALGGAAGRIPLVGDNDSGKAFPVVVRDDADVEYMYAIGNCLFGRAWLPAREVPPEAALLFGTSELPSGPPGGADLPARLPDSGFFILGDERTRMIVRCGPTTYRPVGGHRHLDELSVVLTVDGLEILADPGQFCYTPWPERSLYYRGTTAHNTVVVDGRLQAPVLLDPIGYAHTAVGRLRSRCTLFTHGAEGASFEGRHDGYRRLRGGADHVRRVEYDARGAVWCIRDRLDLTGPHRLTWYFHLHPEARARPEGARWVIRRDAWEISMECDMAGARGRLAADTYSPGYGMEVAAEVLVFETEQVGPVEASFRLSLNRAAAARVPPAERIAPE